SAVFFLTLSFSEVLGCVMSAERRVNGSEGESVEIKCNYPDGYQYKKKYWCRHPCGNKDVLIKTGKTDTVVSVGRFSLFDNVSSRTFTVTMSRLTLQDTGVYYCGLEQWGTDRLSKIDLRVRKGLGCVTSAERRVSGSEGGSVEIRCDYPDGYQYKEKYWCRHPCGNKDVLIKTGKTDTVVSVGRFSLFVNISVRTFTVTMSRLTLQDTGVYYCGLEQWGPDKYTEMLLRVTEHTQGKNQSMTVSILSTSMPVTVLMDITKTAAMDSSTQSA
uniref:Ig-like domain-containing protein n=1 Tax=Lepisosteus oculatus TaxID=7918 RepID=W5MVS3_LEPOC